MDIIITDHSENNLEEKYQNKLIFQNQFFSIMGEETKIPWLQFIPNKEFTTDYSTQLYQEIYKLAEFLKREGFGEHYNIAKIGNKLPYYHIHIVLRSQTDEAWPEPIWCKDNLTPSVNTIERLKTSVQNYFKKY